MASCCCRSSQVPSPKIQYSRDDQVRQGEAYLHVLRTTLSSYIPRPGPRRTPLLPPHPTIHPVSQLCPTHEIQSHDYHLIFHDFDGRAAFSLALLLSFTGVRIYQTTISFHVNVFNGYEHTLCDTQPTGPFSSTNDNNVLHDLRTNDNDFTDELYCSGNDPISRTTYR